jgi:hypothetical protein
MIKRSFTLAVVISSFLPATVFAQMTPEEAFAAGKSAGGDAHTQAIKDNIGAPKAEEVIQGYSASPPPQADYWGGGGSGTLLAPIVSGGSEKITDCAGPGLLSADPVAKQHCEAVDAIAKQPTNKPTNLLDHSDPIIMQGNAIANDPAAIAGAIDGIYAGCTTTTSNATKTTLETCTEFPNAVTGANACVFGDSVVLQPDTVYRCQESLYKLQPSSCTVGDVIIVDPQYAYQCKTDLSETHKCRRKYAVNAEYVETDEYKGFTVGGQCTNGHSRTYAGNFVVEGEPKKMILSSVSTIQWTQVWINGVKVYTHSTESFQFDHTDYRHCSDRQSFNEVTYNPVTGDPFYTFKTGIVFADGTTEYFGNYISTNKKTYDVNPDLDVTEYFQEGTNKIEVSCINYHTHNNSDDRCAARINGMFTKKDVVTEKLVHNECAPYEARAGN